MTLPDSHADDMARMLRDIDMEYSLTLGLTGRAAMPARIREAFRRIPRHRFVPTDMHPFAYENHPLPIGHGQTISQPFIVALMTDLLDPREEDRILEVGCGCGYQAALLSLLAREVYSTEIIPQLATTAGERLRKLGYGNVKVGSLDGYHGWPEHAPFDGIIVTAAAPSVPPPLFRQLKAGGRLILPVGPPMGFQKLVAITKGRDSSSHAREEVLGVAFVPLTGDHHET